MSIFKKVTHEAENRDPLLEKLNTTYEELRHSAVETHNAFDQIFMTVDREDAHLGSYHNAEHILATLQAVEVMYNTSYFQRYLRQELNRYNLLFGQQIPESHLLPLLKISLCMHDYGNIMRLHGGYNPEITVGVREVVRNDDEVEEHLIVDIIPEADNADNPQGAFRWDEFYTAASAEERGVAIAREVLRNVLPGEYVQFVQRAIMCTKFLFLEQIKNGGGDRPVPTIVSRTAPFEVFMKLVDQIGAGWFVENYLRCCTGLVREAYVEDRHAKLGVNLEYSFLEFPDAQLRLLLRPLGMTGSAVESLITDMELNFAMADGRKGSERTKTFFLRYPALAGKLKSAKTRKDAIELARQISRKPEFLT